MAIVLLAGEAIVFDADLQVQFTAHQLEQSAPATRAGLAQWAATAEGRRLITRFRSRQYEITIVEDSAEPGTGRAPQPVISTILAAPDRRKLKRYMLILNPALADQYQNADALRLGQPASPGEVMAAAWAAEMLHIDFYANGIPLPHHHRADFQERWRAVASELGLPHMTHDSDAAADSTPPRTRPSSGRTSRSQ